MISFVEKFKDEVGEYFERLESGLLLLEHELDNQNVIDEIFRIMHSLKGSGGMFGFDLISEVTHDLESLYDLFRSKKQKVDSEVITFTLSSIDSLKRLMVQEPNSEHRLIAGQMIAETKQQIARITNIKYIQDSIKLTLSGTSNQSAASQTTYFISFIPGEDIFS